MNKSKLNYWVDICIGISFVVSAISGLVFLLPIESSSGIAGISYIIWDTLHTWSSLSMIVGVLAHLVLHWKWIIKMTKRMLSSEKDRARTPATNTTSARRMITRRQFLTLGLATLFTGVVAAGCSVFIKDWNDNAVQDDETDESDDSSQPVQQQDTVVTPGAQPDSPPQQEDNTIPTDEPEQPTLQQSGVACPKGLVNDPYPGRCKHYIDRDGDGFCDYSVLGSGNN